MAVLPLEAASCKSVPPYSHLLVQAVSNVAAMSNDARRVKLVAINAEQLEKITAQVCGRVGRCCARA